MAMDAKFYDKVLGLLAAELMGISPVAGFLPSVFINLSDILLEPVR